MLNQNFKYSIGDVVSILRTTRRGVIDMCGIDHGGEHYLIDIEDNDGHIQSRWNRVSQLKIVDG